MQIRFIAWACVTKTMTLCQRFVGRGVLAQQWIPCVFILKIHYVSVSYYEFYRLTKCINVALRHLWFSVFLASRF